MWMSLPRFARVLIACAAGACLLGVVHAESAGEILYRRGVLPSGEALRGSRGDGGTVEGANAACVSCHKRSGLGSTEGQITIPPIAGPYLYHISGQRIDARTMPYAGATRVTHQAYTDATLARAIRAGIGSDGRQLSYLMPRYAIDDAAMAQLIGYLKALAPGLEPGVTDTVLHFATIITPDADPVARDGMLDVLAKYFQDKNAAARAIAPRLYTTRPMKFRVNRRWQLHVWTLSGPPTTWEAQLRANLAAEPVFAVISGLGGGDWAPVHRFCESESLPCLFPNVAVPAVAPGDTYELYFSKGVLLEAQLIAKSLRSSGGEVPPRHIVQVYRNGDAGEDAAAELRRVLHRSGLAVEDRALRRDATDARLHAAVDGIGAGDALVLWLRPQDLQQLPAHAPVASHIWMSGLMGGLEEAPLPSAWRAKTLMAYPVDLPDRRRVRVDYALGWFRIRQIPLVAEQVQVDTYLACGLLSETINHMVDTFQRDFLIERIDDMLDQRVLTGYYPRLTLGTGQSFASKGGFIVRFAQPMVTPLIAASDWTVP